MAWDRIRNLVFRKKRDLPDGLWMRCDDCGNLIYKKIVEERFRTCPECNYHFNLSSRERVDLLLDDGRLEELWGDLTPLDPLEFTHPAPYKDKVIDAQRKTGLRDAMIAGRGKIKGRSVVIGITDSRFMMGSMGSVVGEKVTRCLELGLEERTPVIIVSGSGGGARMYEGCLSLMQMAKTSAAIARLNEAGILFVSVLTNPTMAGVMASFASLGDIMIAEPKALIGFTGPRVIEQTIKQKLPEGFQRSEFMLEHGFIDMIVERQRMRDELAVLLDYCGSPAAGVGREPVPALA